jgi:hypothetical protein
MSILDDVRKKEMSKDVPESEIEMRGKNSSLEEIWREMQALKVKIAEEKVSACKAVDALHADEMKRLEGQYGLLYRMAR